MPQIRKLIQFTTLISYCFLHYSLPSHFQEWCSNNYCCSFALIHLFKIKFQNYEALYIYPNVLFVGNVGSCAK